MVRCVGWIREYEDFLIFPDPLSSFWRWRLVACAPAIRDGRNWLSCVSTILPELVHGWFGSQDLALRGDSSIQSVSGSMDEGSLGHGMVFASLVGLTPATRKLRPSSSFSLRTGIKRDVSELCQQYRRARIGAMKVSSKSGQ